MHDVYLLLGTNTGNRKENILKVEKLIAERMGKIKTRSRVFESKAWGYESSNMFLNRVLIIQTEKLAHHLLIILQEIEKSMGRKKTTDKYEDRLIDIDILFYENQVLKTNDLIIPHPRLHLRKFTLVPLAETSGDFLHPVFQKTINELLDSCPDQSELIEYIS